MAELATIARPYAEGLFKAVGADAGSTSEWLDPLAVVAADEQLLQFADNPKATSEQVLAVIAASFERPLPAMGQNFLRTVIDSGRLAAVPEIAQQFRALKNTKLGAFDATVYSAFEMDSAALADLSGVLEKRFARKLNLQVQLQPDLIGGIRVVVGDEVLDTSIKARLQQMKAALTA